MYELCLDVSLNNSEKIFQNFSSLFLIFFLISFSSFLTFMTKDLFGPESILISSKNNYYIIFLIKLLQNYKIQVEFFYFDYKSFQGHF